MLKTRKIAILALLLNALTVYAQNPEEKSVKQFDQASQSIFEKLTESVAELNKLREQTAAEKIPLSRNLSDLENELIQTRLEYQQVARLLDTRTLDLSNLRSEIKSRQDELNYLSNLLGEYTRNFESRLHIAELHRYQEKLDASKLAPENSNLSEQETYDIQTELLAVSIERLNDALGGTKFDGTAADSTGSIHHGTFILVGPVAFFESDDGKSIGTAEQRLGSLAPSVIRFENPGDAAAVAEVMSSSKGFLPVDPTLGNAHKIAETKETLLEHIKKGGTVMYPILALAAVAFIVAFLKWIGMLFVRTPSQKRINALLDAIAKSNQQELQERMRVIKGPVGKMLAAGVEHIKEPRELIEEVMYEKVLSTKLKLERFLPFIAISASAAPLMGLLGTVTGIIATFKMITVFGSGDVKSLSGGISEALITTEYGLMVAIPSLLIHAFLSRKSRGIINEMEKAAVAFVNQISKTPYQEKKSIPVTEPTAPQVPTVPQTSAAS